MDATLKTSSIVYINLSFTAANSTNNYFRNNIIQGYHNLYSLSGVGVGSVQYFEYNDFYDCDFANPTGTGNITQNPNFVDTTYFIPQNTLLQTGTPLSGVEYDYNGTERDTTDPTIGAQEIE